MSGERRNVTDCDKTPYRVHHPWCRMTGQEAKASTAIPRAMAFKTVKAVRAELYSRGGWLETIRDTELPEYAPHLSCEEKSWKHGIWIKDELIDWANEHLI